MVKPEGVRLVAPDGTEYPADIHLERISQDGINIWRVEPPDDCPPIGRNWQVVCRKLPPKTGLSIPVELHVDPE